VLTGEILESGCTWRSMGEDVTAAKPALHQVFPYYSGAGGVLTGPAAPRAG
jgi:hypothetical protein